jgi:hypothetical protein
MEPRNNELKNSYTRYRNTLNKLISITKSSFYRAKLNEHRSNSKELWKCMKDIIGIDKTKNEQIKINLNTLNHFFVDVGKSYAEKIPPLTDTRSDALLYGRQCRVDQSLFLTPVSEIEVEQVISTLKNSSSPGPDGVTNNTIKIISNLISSPLTFIINKIFETGKFPMLFKIARIKPLYKAGNPNLAENYRPISLISNFSKITEKLIKIRLLSFIEKFNIIEMNQYGFLKDKNTEKALSDFVDEIFDNVNVNRKCLTVFIDLAKAFDTVPHSDLLNKLEGSGIRGTALELFKSYLNGRTQYIVDSNGCCSNSMITNNFGLPQGTVLSPILFILYVNDMLKLKLDNCKIISFADDTALIFNDITWNSVYSTAEKGLTNLKKWLDSNTLSMNILKTKYIAFSPTVMGRPPDCLGLRLHVCDGSNIDICGCQLLERVSQTKYLGIIVDENLRWEPHIQYLCKRLRFSSHMFYRARTVLNVRELKILYFSLVQSILQYGLIIWGGTYDCHMSNLFITQKMIIKTIMFKPRLYSSEQLFNDFQVLTVRQLYIKCLFKFIYKYKTTFNIRSDIIYGLRPESCNKYQIRNSKFTILRRQLKYISSKLINVIPNKLIPVKKIIHREQVCWIKSNFFDSIERII